MLTSSNDRQTNLSHQQYTTSHPHRYIRAPIPQRPISTPGSRRPTNKHHSSRNILGQSTYPCSVPIKQESSTPGLDRFLLHLKITNTQRSTCLHQLRFYHIYLVRLLTTHTAQTHRICLVKDSRLTTVFAWTNMHGPASSAHVSQHGGDHQLPEPRRAHQHATLMIRSEERRVGKECLL